MRKQKQLALTIAAMTVAGTLVSASAFAENRPWNVTRGRQERRDGNMGDRARGRDASRGRDEMRNGSRDGEARRDARIEGRSEARSDRTWRGDRGGDSRFESRLESRGDVRRDWRGDVRQAPRAESRPRSGYDNRAYRNRSYDNRSYDNRAYRNRSYDNRSYDNRSYDNRSYGNRSYGNYGNNRQPYYAHGRVSRVDRYGSGYRVWVGGARYPFFVPLAHWRADRFRIGVSIQLGGYYNPGGYYDYYDGYDNRAYSRGDLRGTVESVDYRRDTFVVRNDATGSFVTVAMRDRRRNDIRQGDYVEISGDWTRSGVFQAYNVNILDYDGYGR